MLDTTADLVYGQADFASSDATGERAFATPRDLYAHGSGVLFVSDTPNNRVLGWSDVANYQSGTDPDIVIGQPDFASTTPANPPTAASLNQPTGITMDDAGNLYVADTGNNRILVFVPEVDQSDPDLIPVFTSGMSAEVVIGHDDFASTTPANPPTASSLNQPQGVALDSRQNLVVADTGNNRVLIFPGKEEMLVPVETGAYANYVIGHPSDNSAQIGDFTVKNTPESPTATSLNQPTDVAVGAVADTLYVADTGNNRVLVYTKAIPVDARADYVIGQPDMVSNTANNGGIGNNSLNNPTGLAVDCSNRLYIADTGNNRVLTFLEPQTTSPSADTVFGQGGSFTTGDANQGGLSADSLSAPTGVATDYTTMNAFIADSANQRALEYNHPLQNAQPVISELWPGTIEAGSSETQIEVWGLGIVGDSWDSEGMLVPGSTIQVNGTTRSAEHASTTGGFALVTIFADELAQTGTLTITITTPAPGGGVSAAATLEVFTPTEGDTRADAVLGQPGFNTSGSDFIPPTAKTLFYPNSIAVDPQSGRVFAADSANSRILSWSSLNNLTSNAAADMVIGQPDFTSNLIGLPERNGTSASTLAFPQGVTLDNNGNLYVADTYNHRVLVFQAPLSNGMDATTVIGQPDFTTSTKIVTPTAATLLYPQGLTLDEQGNLYVADSENHRVLVYQPPLSNGMDASSVIGQLDMTSNTPTTSDTGLSYPTDVEHDSQGNLYVADSENNRVLLFATGTTTASIVFGQQGDFTANAPNNGGLSADSLANPLGVAVDGSDNLIIADRGNERVLFFQAPPTHDTTADQVIGQESTTTLQASLAADADSFSGPVDMLIDESNQLAVVDNNNSRVLIFDNPSLQPVDPMLQTIYLPLVQR
jgi:sugar lactone lactonase YvrE